MLLLHTIYPLIKAYIIEIILLLLALIITGYSIFAYTSPELPPYEEPIHEPNIVVTKPVKQPSITIDVSGAVLKPDIYEVTEGARLMDVIKIAGGFDNDVDKGYVSRNFNMAQFVTDQQKIYIPFKKDIQEGRFVESPQILEYMNQPSSTTATEKEQNQPDQQTISINTSTKEDLDMLPGVGPTTAQKIIDNRPYTAIEELLNKKVVKQTVFDDIQGLISL